MGRDARSGESRESRDAGVSAVGCCSGDIVVREVVDVLQSHANPRPVY